MGGVTTTNSAYILKTLYPQKRVENLVYKDHAFLAMVPKNEKFYGDSMVVAVRFADTQGRSVVFSTAQANVGNHQGVKFILTRVKDYQVVSLETEAIQAAENDMGALIANYDTEIKSGLNNISKSLALNLFGTGSGAIGQRGSISSNTVTLKNINDITSFEVGMFLMAAQTETGAIRAGTYPKITAVDRDLGTITLDDQSKITSFSDNDYLFPQGDAQNGGSAVRMKGLRAWLPATAPVASESFFSVDRSVDTTRLGGLRIDCSGLNPEEAVATALSKLGREGASPSHFFVNHLDQRNIVISIGSKVVYKPMSVGEIGFSSVELLGPKGPVSLIADQDNPSGTGFALTMDTWKLHSLKKAPQILDLDGDPKSRVYNADQWEARIAYYAQLGCDAPGWNANVVMPA